jgi:hypothetical protein
MNFLSVVLLGAAWAPGQLDDLTFLQQSPVTVCTMQNVSGYGTLNPYAVQQYRPECEITAPVLHKLYKKSNQTR